MSDIERVEFAEAFKKRTKKFVVDNIKFYRTLPKIEETKIIHQRQEKQYLIKLDN
jgi:hypothetical protein